MALCVVCADFVCRLKQRIVSERAAEAAIKQEAEEAELARLRTEREMKRQALDTSYEPKPMHFRLPRSHGGGVCPR